MSGHRFSPLTRRILVVNVLPLVMLGAGMLYVDNYREGLIEAELAGLRVQADIFAGALGEAATGVHPDGSQFILSDVARPMLRRLVGPTRARALVFEAGGEVVADSRFLVGRGMPGQVEVLNPEDNGEGGPAFPEQIYDLVSSLFPDGGGDPPFPEAPVDRLDVLPELTPALQGAKVSTRWSLADGGLVLGAGASVQRFKKVLGAVVVTTDTEAVEAAVRNVRLDIVRTLIVVMGITILLSLYLGRSIARPVRHLARAADTVRQGQGEMDTIPDFTRRRDEIGDLSGSLREMTRALSQRMTANERFAADVAHEMKNPLTSLGSAVETVSRVSDQEQKATLMTIIEEDVKRLDRLITDISDASRLDVELARRKMKPLDLDLMLHALAEIHNSGEDAPIRLVDSTGACIVSGIEDRLMQVLQNLIANARSFTPPARLITVSARRVGSEVIVHVEDEGTGIPPESLEAIFERFYSERPAGESFGRHSGLGLSISRQIIEAHGGHIHAENICRENGSCRGARFVIRLPAVDAGGPDARRRLLSASRTSQQVAADGRDRQ